VIGRGEGCTSGCNVWVVGVGSVGPTGVGGVVLRSAGVEVGVVGAAGCTVTAGCTVMEEKSNGRGWSSGIRRSRASDTGRRGSWMEVLVVALGIGVGA